MKTVSLPKEKIDEIFEISGSQEEYIIKLYEEVIPNFDKINKLKENPKISKSTNHYLFEKAIKFDNKYHDKEKIIPGGAWMNYGFSTDNNVTDWEVDISNIEGN